MQARAADSAPGQMLAHTGNGLTTGLSISSSGLITRIPTGADASNATVIATEAWAAEAASFTGAVGHHQPRHVRLHGQASPAQAEWIGGFTDMTPGRRSHQPDQRLDADLAAPRRPEGHQHLEHHGRLVSDGGERDEHVLQHDHHPAATPSSSSGHPDVQQHRARRLHVQPLTPCT